MTASGRSRRGLLGPAALAATGLLAPAGCTLLLDRSGQCTTHAECQARDPRQACSVEGVCVLLEMDVRRPSGSEGNECRGDVDCRDGSAPRVCRDGFCRYVESPGRNCIVLRSTASALTEAQDAMLIGVLSSVDELGLSSPNSNERPFQPTRGVATAISTALAELNAARVAQQLSALPPLAAVACNENDPLMLEYLIDSLHVPVIFGPSSPERVDVALLRTQNRALLVPPFADGPDLEDDASDGFGWVLSCRPNRRSVAAYFLEAIVEGKRYIEETTSAAPLNVALLVGSDVATASFADALDAAALTSSGVRRLNYGDATGLELLNVISSVAPPVDLVVAASMAEDWATRMREYDQAYFERSGKYPYYLLADKRADVVERSLGAEDTELPRYLRWLGLDYQRPPLSEELREAFVRRHELETQQAAGVGLEYAYDCTYVTVYAALAAGLRLRRPLSRLNAEAIVTGLGALVGGELQRVGELNVASVMEALTRQHGWDGAMDLIGASGSLDIQASGQGSAENEERRYFSVLPPDGELYCIDAVDRAICDTGIVFPRSGGPPTRLGNDCACLGAR